jgi:5-methyltetrahydrofolate--homocysteine methyltransferase
MPQKICARNLSFDELVGTTYLEQDVGLIDGGADILIVETIFDALNAKAALYVIAEFLEYSGLDIPVFVSGTLVDQSGRTLSGQTGEAFYASIRHAKPMCVGLKCALGAQHMVLFVERLANVVECFLHVYINADLPNAMGWYDDNGTTQQGVLQEGLAEYGGRMLWVHTSTLQGDS